MEAVITPDGAPQNEAVILLLGKWPKQCQAALVQQTRNLVFLAGKDAARVPLCSVEAGRPAHIVVTSGQGRVICYKDGNEAATGSVPPLAFSDWPVVPFSLGGGGPEGAGDWRGAIEGVALYARALSASEVRVHAEVFGKILAARKPIPVLKVCAKLIAKSPVPSLDELAPYTQSLSVYAYEVEKVVEGSYDKKTLYVAHWCVLDRIILPFKDVPLMLDLRSHARTL